MITIKNESQIDKMRKAGALLHSVLEQLRAEIEPGVTTKHLDNLAEHLIRKAGGKPSFKGYEGFPYSICASVDDQVVHGFATDKKLRKGQLLSVDCGVVLDGWQSDSAFSVLVGGGDERQKELVRVTEECFWIGANMAREGNRLGDLSYAVQKHAEAHGFGVVRDMTGHGIGRQMHEDPTVPNFGIPGRGVRFRKGMTIAIEPMITLGTWRIHTAANNWTTLTDDGSLCSHYEHTVLITDGEPEVLSYPGAVVAEEVLHE